MSYSLFLASLCIFSLGVYAQGNCQKGEHIAKIVEEANRGFYGTQAELQLIIKINDEQVIREMQRLSIEVDDGVRSLFIFKKPLDIKGTKLLTWTHKTKEDDQWLYLKSIRRVKRISSSSKTSSFMGSEFTFEDLAGQEKEKFTTCWVKDESLSGEQVWLLERTPKYKSGYSKVISYISQDKKSVLRSDYYNRSHKLFKRAIFSDFKQYSIGKKQMYRANKIVMTNLQAKRESRLLWKKRKLGISHSHKLFTSQRLRR